MSTRRGLKKFIAGIIGVAVIGAVFYGASHSDQAQSGGQVLAASSDGLYPIRTWNQTNCSSTPWIVADQKGFFAEEGLKVVYTGDTQPAQQIPSVINGDNDVGGGNMPNTLAVAINGGAKIKGVVAGTTDPAPELDPRLRHMTWYVTPESGIKSFKDLNNIQGKVKFSTITTNTCADFLANNIADKSGVPRDKIEWATMPDIQAVQAVKQGLVTVAGVHPPYYKSMEDAGMVKIADSFDAGLGPEAGISLFYFKEDFINQHPDVVKKFSRAIVKAEKWSNDNPEEARLLTENWIHVPVSATHYYYANPNINPRMFDTWIKDLEDNKVIPAGKLKAEDLLALNVAQ
ncbi:ABC transporter substrate-binding protein [Pectinatus haikarae]|uniref:ABC-type nitrate/sulfonate/bicarbonate transport system substrate-binding protein n=1 Tax=Pectinatus haikarae TaxID=349096 RepID=A0ABT9Y9J4_9FIRM|nr:ABC transporter substrate-binding protein [Pectinatus haikarae]MDQ0204513.1 ABC-type nitrate/sulfonate/bicarbonate transport system substrate-binding protein [Pectinatus haikarae]